MFGIMKQNLFLWLGTIIIVFLAGYMRSTLGPYYPVSGAIGLDGQPVTFKFDKIYRGIDGYIVSVNTDVKDLKAFVLWSTDKGENWQKTEMNYSGKLYTGKLPRYNPGQKINYRVEMIYKGALYYLPVNKPVTIVLWGKVNAGILQIYYFVLFGGLILAVRTGFEIFKDNPKFGVYTVFSFIFFFLYSICLVPLVKTYELNAINHSVPNISQLLSLQSVSLLTVWIAGMAAIFNLRRNKYIPPIVSVLTLIIYITINV